MLNILGRRSDGFHELETLFHHIPIYDTITLEDLGADFRFTCSSNKIPTGSENLVYRAAMSFFTKAGIKPRGHIHLEKNLPSEAGVGGGSANAAITLRALNAELENILTQEDLHAIAASLGADVAFFLLDGPAIGYGRGERLEPLPPFDCLRGSYALLIKPSFGVSTAWAYKTLKQYPQDLNGRPGRVREFADILRHGTLRDAAPHFYNSLEAPVLAEYPILKDYQTFLCENGADVALMSGSGSTTFALFSDKNAAEKMPALFQERFGVQSWMALTRFAL